MLVVKLTYKFDFDILFISDDRSFLKIFLILKVFKKEFFEINLLDIKNQKISKMLANIGKRLPKKTLILLILASCSPNMVNR